MEEIFGVLLSLRDIREVWVKFLGFWVVENERSEYEGLSKERLQI